jgi:hypothetical protein
MREHAPIHNTGTCSSFETGAAPIRRRPNWPFLYYQHNGKIYRNPVKQETKAQQLAKIEDALL